MYINLNLFLKSGLENSDLIFLTAIAQTESQYLIENLTENTYNRFEALKLIKHIKPKNKKEHRYNSLRLSEGGKKLLSELETPDVEEQDILIFNWLKKYYLERDKEIGNSKKTLSHIKNFRVKSCIEKNNLIKLVLHFLEQNEERSRRLEYIFYFSKTPFATKFDLEESWLWKHFIKNKETIEKQFEEY